MIQYELYITKNGIVELKMLEIYPRFVSLMNQWMGWCFYNLILDILVHIARGEWKTPGKTTSHTPKNTGKSPV